MSAHSTVDVRKSILTAKRNKLITFRQANEAISHYQRHGVLPDWWQSAQPPAQDTETLPASRYESVTYKSLREFNKKQAERVAAGWVLETMTGPAKGRVTITRAVMFAPAALTGWRKGRGSVTVVWRHD